MRSTLQANRVFYVDNDQAGWAPITHMAGLLCRLLEAIPHDLSNGRLSGPMRVYRTAFPPPHRADAAGDIFILRNPTELTQVLGHPSFQDRRSFRALWIIDSFWTDHFIKPAGRLLSYFDLVCYTRQGDSDFYERLCRDRAVFLGWGTDALDLGASSGARLWDILRVGRQPLTWDNDTHTEAACNRYGLRFHGRPPFGADPTFQQRDLMRDWYSRTKFLIGHSNLAAPAPYTHPTKDYITARWTDALACGAVVAGVPPAGDLTLIDWPGSLLKFDEIDLEANLEQIQEANRVWTQKIATHNRLEALRRLDWRWRIAKLAEMLRCSTDTLKADMQRLDTEIALHEKNLL